MSNEYLKSLFYIGKNLSRLMKKIETGLKYPDFFIPFPDGIEPSLQEFKSIILSEIQELNMEYSRGLAYIDSINDDWTKRLFELRFIEGKSFREIGQLFEMTPAHMKSEIYGYLSIHPEGFLSCRELATRWGFNVNTVNSYCRRGLLPGAVKRTNRVWMIPANAQKPNFDIKKGSHKNSL